MKMILQTLQSHILFLSQKFVLIFEMKLLALRATFGV